MGKYRFPNKDSFFEDGILPFRQPTTNVKEAFEDAQEAVPLLSDIANYIIQTSKDSLICTGHDTTLTNKSLRMGKMKSETRLRAKAIEEKGDISKICDIARGTIDGSTPEEIAALSAFLDMAYWNEIELPGGARIIDLKNRFEEPTLTDYSSVKAKIAVPLSGKTGRDYHIVELMVTHKGFEQDIKNQNKNRFHRNSHETYELEREIEGRFKSEDLGPEISKKLGRYIRIARKTHKDLKEKHGLNRIDYKPFEKFFEIRLEIEKEEQAKTKNKPETEIG